MLASLAWLGKPDGRSAYLGLSTRAVDQTLVAILTDRAARDRRRRQVTAGAYPLRHCRNPVVVIAAMGATVADALAAADRLARSGVAADVVCVTSPDLLFRAWRARQERDDAPSWVLDQAFPAARATPLVTVLDGNPHTLAFLANISHVPAATLGVSEFGQSGSLSDVYRQHRIDVDSIVGPGLDLVPQLIPTIRAVLDWLMGAGGHAPS